MRQTTHKILCFFMIALFTLASSGCTPTAKTENISAAAAASTAGAASFAPPPGSLPSYRIQIGDMIQVKMLVNPELDEEVVVQPDGMISTAVVQNMSAYGKTTKELQRDLIRAYKKELINPQLTVIVKSFAPSKIYVLGEVASPGEMISVGPNITLLQALSRAGGLLNSAEENNIMIIRHGLDGKDQIYQVDYEAATKGVDPTKDVQLAAYDVVFVPRTGVANVYKSFQQNFQQFLPGSFGLGYGLR